VPYTKPPRSRGRLTVKPTLDKVELLAVDVASSIATYVLPAAHFRTHEILM
jgi:hypothetical protein